MRRQLLRLVLAVLVVHALFIAAFYVVRIAHASAPVKLGYTAAWTAVTLVVALRGLVRIRALRSRGAGHRGSARG